MSPNRRRVGTRLDRTAARLTKSASCCCHVGSPIQGSLRSCLTRVCLPFFAPTTAVLLSRRDRAFVAALYAASARLPGFAPIAIPDRVRLQGDV
jgi:hypothetical protein